MTYTDIAIYAHRSDRSLPVFAGNTLTFDGDTLWTIISISKDISGTITRLRNYRKIPELLGQVTKMVSKCLEAKTSVRTEELRQLIKRNAHIGDFKSLAFTLILLAESRPPTLEETIKKHVDICTSDYCVGCSSLSCPLGCVKHFIKDGCPSCPVFEVKRLYSSHPFGPIGKVHPHAFDEFEAYFGWL